MAWLFGQADHLKLDNFTEMVKKALAAIVYNTQDSRSGEARASSCAIACTRVVAWCRLVLACTRIVATSPRVASSTSPRMVTTSPRMNAARRDSRGVD